MVGRTRDRRRLWKLVCGLPPVLLTASGAVAFIPVLTPRLRSSPSTPSPTAPVLRPPARRPFHSLGLRRGSRSPRWTPLRSKPEQQRQAKEPNLGAGAAALLPSIGLYATFVNLTKNMVGSNVLFLPDAVRIAHGIPVALVMLAVIGLFSYVSMVLLAACCEKTQCFSYRDLWMRAFGDRTLWLVDLCIGANSLIACVSYCLLIERFVEVAVQGLLPGSALAALPSAAKLAAIVGLVVFPLSLMRDLSSLKGTSSVGLGVTLLVAIFVVQDFVSNYSLPLPGRGGLTSPEILSSWDPQPGTHLFQAAALLTNAFSVHYNVPKFYGEIDAQERSVGTFCQVALATFAFALLTELAFIFGGYGRFGNSVESTLLSSYPASPVSLVCWLLMAANITVTYPIVFNSVQTSFMAMLEAAPEDNLLRSLATGNRTAFTALLVGATAILGHRLDSLSLINAIKGALFLSATAFIFPGLLHARIFKGAPADEGGGALAGALSRLLVIWGLLSAAVGLAVVAFR